MSKESNKKERSSIITIILVLVFLSILALTIISIINKQNNIKDKNKEYVSNLDEEDMMQYEYTKIDSRLNKMYAFAQLDNWVVAVLGIDKFVNLVQIDTNKEYDYCYNNACLYLLEKESGKITLVDLNKMGEIKAEINLEDNVQSFEIYKNSIYYISNNKLMKYENGKKEEILLDITSNNLVLKNDYIYIVKSNNLVKVDFNRNETKIADNVKEIYYYNYYERDRLIYDTNIDNINTFKNIYNYYTGSINNSVKNNTYFVPYGASKYIYTTLDKSNLVSIGKSGITDIIYSSYNQIENINFHKEGYIVLKEDNGKNIVINLETNKEEEHDNIINLYNIKYLK